MSDRVRVRPAEEKELAGIHALLESRALPLPEERESLEVFAAIRREALVGSVSCEVHAPFVLIRGLAVARSREGLGTDLLCLLMDRLAQRGLEEAWLQTTTAEGFFARAGFDRRERSELPRALRGSKQWEEEACRAAILMSRTLQGLPASFSSR